MEDGVSNEEKLITGDGLFKGSELLKICFLFSLVLFANDELVLDEWLFAERGLLKREDLLGIGSIDDEHGLFSIDWPFVENLNDKGLLIDVPKFTFDFFGWKLVLLSGKCFAQEKLSWLVALSNEEGVPIKTLSAE